MIDVERQLLDKAKQAGLYQDDDGSDAPSMREFTADDIDAVVRDAHSALASVPDQISMHLAHQLYEANLKHFPRSST